MTMQAGRLSHAAVPRADPQGVGMPTGGEVQGVNEPVFSLQRVFPNEAVVRRVAIIADGHRAMTGLLPGGEVLAHHVAVGARRGIIGEVRSASCHDERVV